jgi:hypothetical protein
VANEVVNEYAILTKPSVPGETVEDADKRLKERHEWDDIGNAIKVLTEAVNKHNAMKVAKMMYVALKPEHRTLQNQLIASMLFLMEIYKDTDYDLRNWSAVVASDRIAEVVKNEDIVFPLI